MEEAFDSVAVCGDPNGSTGGFLDCGNPLAVVEMLKVSTAESGKTSAELAHPQIALVILKDRVQRGVNRRRIVKDSDGSVDNMRQRTSTVPDPKTAIVCLQDRVNCLVRQAAAVVPHFDVTIGKQMRKAVAVAAKPHTAVAGLKQIANIVARQSLRFAEDTEFTVAQLDETCVERAHP